MEKVPKAMVKAGNQESLTKEMTKMKGFQNMRSNHQGDPTDFHQMA